MKLDVYLAGARVGVLEQDDIGRMSFTYDGGRRDPVLSVRMPRRSEPYDDAACRVFFENLLPEAKLLEAAASARRIEPWDTFGLLREYGRDCPGAVSVVPEGAPPPGDDGYEAMSDDDMADAIRHLDDDPNFASDRRVRLSLAGAQGKTAVAVFDGQVHKPLGGSASTHIIKAATSQEFHDIARNEGFCMALAARCGFRAPKVEIRSFRGRECLFIERYDRIVEGRSVRRLHQEDLCQALGFGRAQKYEFRKEHAPDTGEDVFEKIGPGVVEAIKALSRTRVPLQANTDFARRLVYNYLVGNADAHTKNFGLLYESGAAAPVLAPVYDVVCTRLYPRVSEDFAMAIGHARTPDEIDPAAWSAVFGVHALSRLVPRIASEMIDTVLREARALMSEAPFGHGPPYSRILACIGDRAIRLGECIGRDIEPSTPPFVLRAGGWLTSS